MEPPKSANSLGRIWTHTAGVAAFLAALVSIIGFFGFRPPQNPESKKGEPPKQASTPDKASGGNVQSPDRNVKPGWRGTGTLHIDGGFEHGRGMLTKSAISASAQPEALVLTNPSNAKDETVTDLIVTGPADPNQLVLIWRKGSRFVHGIRLKSEHPHLRLTGESGDFDIPVDADGKLLVNVAWPATKMFLKVEYAGPIEIGGLVLEGGLVVGDSQTGEAGKTLPERFALDLPRPGEALAAFKGEFTYPGGASGARYVVVREDSKQDQAAATWSTELKPGQVRLENDKAGGYDQGLNAIQILYSKSQN